MSDPNKTECREPVASSEIVSLCESLASDDAQRKLVEIWHRPNCPEALKLFEAFILGFQEGQSAQANDKLTDAGPSGSEL